MDFHIQVIVMMVPVLLVFADEYNRSSFQFEKSPRFQSIINSSDKQPGDYFEKARLQPNLMMNTFVMIGTYLPL